MTPRHLRPYRLLVDDEAYEVHLGRGRAEPTVFRMSGEVRQRVAADDPVLVPLARLLRTVQRRDRVLKRPTWRRRIVGWVKKVWAALVSWWRRVVW
jgi:hypothetical protein